MSDIERIQEDIKSITDKIDDIKERIMDLETDSEVSKEKATVAMGERMKLRRDLDKAMKKFKIVAKKFYNIEKRHIKEDFIAEEQKEKKELKSKILIGIFITVMGGLTLLLITKGWPLIIKLLASLA